MKKFYIIALCVMTALSVLLVASCGSGDVQTTESTSANETTVSSEVTTSMETTTDMTTTGSTETTSASEETTSAVTETTSTTETTTEETTASTETTVPKDSIKILAIGNSFSDDSMEHLYGILDDCGAENIVLGRLYIGGCSLQTHASNAKNNSAAYQYYVNKNGTWVKYGASIASALIQYDWDYISMQQVSGLSGMPDSYEPYLTELIEYVLKVCNKYCPNAKLIWNMTWAYQGNSSHSDFAKYERDQMTMYNAIVNAVHEKVLTHDEFSFVIPTGTAIQNLRTSFVGDSCTRDGYHLDYGFGRYAAAMMWAKQITGWDIDGVTWTPEGYPISKERLAAIKEAVDNAYRDPYAVTRSEMKDVKETGTCSGDSGAKTTDELFESAGYDLSDYKKLEITFTQNAYYNSTDATYKSKIISAATGSSASNLTQFSATQIFSKTDIPVGSVIVLLDGYQYRPEGWKATNQTNGGSERPANVTALVTKVTDSWWGNWNFRAFNVAKKGNPSLSPNEMNALSSVFAIYVPTV